ncbi:uncharacterized protein [Montipora foliosa]|uniref:uncharacterized protein n=1 Tax=Montipora foliosa TaxID=591990 RepID=UPI0035F100BE
MANALRKRKPTCRVHIFNCDGTCNLDEVKSLLEAVGKKVEIRIEVRKHTYELNKTTTLVEKTIPSLKMDYAVLMVHARDNCPSFEDNRYGKIYRTLKERTGSDRTEFNPDDPGRLSCPPGLSAAIAWLLIVIGGDEKYESKQEEEKEFISNCVLKKIGLPHFQRELWDGRKNFMFSWNKKHRPIHEEAMMHSLDPRKRGQKFVCQKKTQDNNNLVTPNVPSRPTQETSVIPFDNKVENQGSVIETNASFDGTDSTSSQVKSRVRIVERSELHQ